MIWHPTFHSMGVEFPLDMARKAFDSFVFVERLGDHEQVTYRCRTERLPSKRPLPLLRRWDAMQYVDEMLGGAA